MNGMFFALVGASLATALAGIGSAKGVGGAAQTAMGVLSEDSSKFGKMLVLTLLPGTQGLYGFIVGFLILVSCGVLGGALPTMGQGLAFLGASLAIGLGGLFSGIAQGKAAVSGIAMTAKDDFNDNNYTKRRTRMNGGDKIIERIKADSKKAVDEVMAQATAECNAIMQAAEKTADKNTADIDAKTAVKLKQAQASSKSRAEPGNIFVRKSVLSR